MLDLKKEASGAFSQFCIEYALMRAFSILQVSLPRLSAGDHTVCSIHAPPSRQDSLSNPFIFQKNTAVVLLDELEKAHKVS
jgi:hypothetical protein